MDREIIPVIDDLGGRPPAPNETFTNRIIHPRNIAIEARRENARVLTGRQFKNYSREARRLDKALNESGFYELSAEYKLLKKRYETYEAELEDSPSNEQREDIEKRLAAVQERARAVRTELAPLMRIAAHHTQLHDLIRDHYLALERQQLHDQLTRALAKEAHKFAEIIIEKWSQLGYKHEYMVKNKRRVDKVQFADIQVMPDAVWLKIAVSRKSWFGFKSTLPNGVRVLDLIEENTLKELSFACQRQVQAKSTYTNGAWVKVNRIGTTDGLLEYVTLEQVLNNYPAADKALLPIGFGVEEGRIISWVHMAKHPHFLIGGTTGAGKSNIVNVIICSLLTNHSPNEVQFCLIDLKEGLEFQRYENVPHLLRTVVKEVDEAATVLGQLESLRKKRSLDLARAGVTDIDQFNAKSEKSMPRIIVIFDEYAAIKIRRDIEKSIQDSVMQLSAKGRAAGIHLILCTQNPSVEIVPGPSKANMAFRLAGAMPTQAASNTILGVGDAARLPDVKGRMLAMCGSKIWQIQTPHAREIDIENALRAAGRYETDLEDKTLIELPEAVARINFGDEELLTILLNDFDGVTKTKEVYGLIKDTHNITFRQLSEQMQALVKRGSEGRTIEHNGEIYKFTAWRKGNKLVRVGTLFEVEST